MVFMLSTFADDPLNASSKVPLDPPGLSRRNEIQPWSTPGETFESVIRLKGGGDRV